MSITRRKFLESSVFAGASLGASRFLKTPAVSASPSEDEVVPAPTCEWTAATPASAYRAYRSKLAKSADSPTWVQIDLGASQPIDLIKVYPANERLYPRRDEHYAGEGFPVRFKIEAAEEPEFHTCSVIVDHTGEDFARPKGRIEQYNATGIQGRYVRLTATRLVNVERGDFGERLESGYYLALAKIDVYSQGQEIGTQRPVTVDSIYGNDDDVAQVTRPERPGGEGIVTDHPENVTPASTWKPPVNQTRAPLKGVTLEGGVFQTTMENNIQYLLNSYSVDDLLRQFRERAHKEAPPQQLKFETKFWEEDLAGSNAGRFLMGAGNTLRWINHPELHRRLEAVVEGIAECRQPNGYIMAYPEDTIFFSERGAYTRAWLTHGLIEAGYAGNTKAFELLRGYYDWFNQCPYLPYLMRFAVQGGQGMIANTRMYHTPVGKPADIQVIQRYFQENFWRDQLGAREEHAVWQYPYDRPHCYLLTNLEAYMDLYRATGDPRYLHMVEGGWELYHDNWENPGGSISIIEYVVCPPRSYQLHAKLEELCGNAFWAFLNQRFQMLDPKQEKYANEIEKSIYNVAMANQAGSDGLRYHALLVDKKEEPTRMNTCCEGQGTRLIGSIPEHIYSIASDGLYVNLFEPSTIEWKQNGEALRLKSVTRFPYEPEVRLQFSAARATQAKIRVRVPSWAIRDMAVSVNGSASATGKPGSYVILDRSWSEGDTLSFTLPAALRLKRYVGVDQIPGYRRYSVEYGPLLMAAVGAADVRLQVAKANPGSLLELLRPVSGQPLHYTIEHNPGVELMPYWQVDKQPFTCLPAVPLHA